MKKPDSILVVCVLLFAVQHAAHACAAVAVDYDRVQVTDESAVIIWDARTHTEHFIRRASFDTQEKNIGFLVPTPAMPVLATADDNVFDALQHSMQPAVQTRVRNGLNFGWYFFPSSEPSSDDTDTSNKASNSAPPAGADVDVVSQAQVGQYSAAVLAATNTSSLRAWLARHHYLAAPALQGWLTPYVRKHWFITAFRLTKPVGGDDEFSSQAVRLSFKTGHPFYPYSEPANQREKGNYAASRSLRVYYIGERRVAGQLGAPGVKWPGQTTWSDAVPDRRALLASAVRLKSTDLPAAMRMTVFEDYASPRPGIADVSFSDSPDQSTMVPEPIVTYVDDRVFMPIEPIILLFLASPWLIAVWKRRHA